MLTYNFEQIEGPLYEYIYKCIKSDIITGRLQPGEKLPSKRSFAKNNGISTITIQNAYDQLISEGYIYSYPKRGYYVAKIDGMKEIPKTANFSLRIKLPKEPESYAIDLSSNRTNPDNFPFSVWAKLCREIITSRSKELMEISPTGGILELRSAIAEHLRSFRGMLVDPDQIVIGAGTEYLYSLFIQLIGEDKIYCIENPGYKKVMQIYKQHKILCKYIDVDDNGITMEGLRKSGADIAHISPTHHFPTGITMPVSRRYELLAWANEKEGRYIIEDDYDSEFRLNGKPIAPLFSIDACEKVIYMNTFSKSLTPTIRISYMILPVHLVNQFYEQLSFYSCTVSNFEQYTLAEFIKRGYFEKHINRMRLHYSRKRKQLIELIERSPLKECASILENDSGLHFLLRLKTDIPDREIVERLKRQGIRVKALSSYFLTKEVKEEQSHLFLINYSNIQAEQAASAFEAFYRSL
ncbi:MocR-like pyridoxine biosynthesis transcription factor PdxR [[Clostridium] polysaccharolyticum]|uniref:GntR family transcriptional regulator / MocR family aminotransferase n=1 Tax=[Clostridium] polysaccharolyticum TaxID=29364 RepID=A0A1I0G0T0_9FIRM|nr:PLP-dependent aminotransferase family protein [[Clostridium] polysaccharolyticum]SET64167.1 GntR family transcriptional regulator / MocR family aminotransferase [[Clostridium] polysaccharolyticum]